MTEINRNVGKYPIDSIMSEQKIKGNKFHIRKPDLPINTFCGYPISFDVPTIEQFTPLEHESVCIKCRNGVKAFGSKRGLMKTIPAEKLKPKFKEMEQIFVEGKVTKVDKKKYPTVIRDDG